MHHTLVKCTHACICYSPPANTSCTVHWPHISVHCTLVFRTMYIHTVCRFKYKVQMQTAQTHAWILEQASSLKIRGNERCNMGAVSFCYCDGNTLLLQCTDYSAKYCEGRVALYLYLYFISVFVFIFVFAFLFVFVFYICICTVQSRSERSGLVVFVSGCLCSALGFADNW